jgi:hypothetical protein
MQPPLAAGEPSQAAELEQKRHWKLQVLGNAVVVHAPPSVHAHDALVFPAQSPSVSSALHFARAHSYFSTSVMARHEAAFHVHSASLPEPESVHAPSSTHWPHKPLHASALVKHFLLCHRHPPSPPPPQAVAVTHWVQKKVHVLGCKLLWTQMSYAQLHRHQLLAAQSSCPAQPWHAFL